MTSMVEDGERALVARLRAGDTGAFDEVFDAYRSRVRAALARELRGTPVAATLKKGYAT
jgi:hypothetical protein